MLQRAKPINLVDSSIVEAVSLIVRPAGKEKIFLGNKRLSVFILIDKSWRPLAKIMKESLTVREISQKLNLKDAINFPKDRVESMVKIMILNLAKYRLIRGIDGFSLPQPATEKNFFSGLISTQKAKKLISSYFWGVPLSLFIAAAALSLWFFPELIPSSADFFWHPRFSPSLFTFFVFGWLTGLCHELAHFLVARARGIKAEISFSNRLYFLVVETRYADIFSVSSKDRIAVYLAGTAIDLAILGAGFLFLIVFPNLPFSHFWFYQIVRQLILVEWLGILWQMLFFMKTDFYFVIKEALGIENLFTYAQAEIKSWFVRTDAKQKSSLAVRLYAVFMLLGTITALMLFIFYQLPIIFNLSLGAMNSFFIGLLKANSVILVDGVIVLLIYFVSLYLFGLSLRKKAVGHL